MNGLRLRSLIVTLLASLIMGCSIYGALSSAVDPSSSSYVGTPSGLSPTGSIHTVKPVLTWQNSSGSTNAAEYLVEVATDNSFSSPIINQTTTSAQYTVGNALTSGDTYYWRVAAMTSGGKQGLWSSVGSFSVASTSVSHTLTVESAGNGTVAIASGASGSSESVQLDSGVSTTISATPSSGYVFSKWDVVSGSPSIVNSGSAITTAALIGGSATVEATFQSGVAPAISYSPGSLGFSGSQGGSNPASQVLVINNSGGGSLSWSAASNQSWLSVSPASGTVAGGTSSTTTISASVSGLSAGTYSGTITISASGVWNSPQTVPVTLTVYSATTKTLVWSDSFESYSAGSFPSTWTASANATDSSTNYVDNTRASSGSQSFKLYGQVGGCWGAIAFHPLDVTPPYEIDFEVYNGTEVLSGCHPQRGSIGLQEGTSWTNPGRGLITFEQSGQILDLNGNVITNYSAGAWYSVAIVYNISGSNVDVSYTINGTTYPQVTASAQSYETSLDHLNLTAEEGSVWFDDVQVYQR